MIQLQALALTAIKTSTAPAKTLDTMPGKVITVHWPIELIGGHIRTSNGEDQTIYLWGPHWRLLRDKPINTVRISDRLVQFVAEFEGFSPSAYLCPSGVPTIGYGSTGGVKMGDRITRGQALDRLKRELGYYGDSVSKLVEPALNQHEFEALVSLVYNIGPGAFENSTLLQCLNKGKFLEAGLEFFRWVKSNGKPLEGLKRRRKAEAKIFFTGDF